MEHALNVNVAIRFDTDTALFLQNLKHWTFKNLANKKHIHDGLCWTYDTLDALCDIFPYWSRRQLERVINNCLKNGLIVKGNYNTTSYDRTCWYAMTPMSYWFYPELADEKYLKLLYSSISPNGEIDYTEWRNRYPESVTTIPDTIPDTDPDTKKPPKPPAEVCVRFKEFWELYPVKNAEAVCLRYWKKTKLVKIADEIIDKLKQQIELDDKFIRGFIRNPSKYLREEGWKDAINKPKVFQLTTVKTQPTYDDKDTNWKSLEVL